MYGVKEPVIAISLDTEGLQFYFSNMLEASKNLGVQVSHISECANNIRYTHKGYKFVNAGDINE